MTMFSSHGDKAYSLQRFITAAIYLISISFAITGLVFLNVWNFDDPTLCNESVRICISFYVVNKNLWYLFLVERAYLSSKTIASERPRRCQSPIFMTGVLAVIIGFTIVDIMTFMHPLASLSLTTAKCHIMLPPRVSMSLLVLELIIHFGLTGVYIYKTWTSFSGIKVKALLPYVKLAILHQVPNCPNGVLMVLMSRSLLGLFLVSIPTAMTMMTLAMINGEAKVWICWIVLTIDGKRT